MVETNKQGVTSMANTDAEGEIVEADTEDEMDNEKILKTKYKQTNKQTNKKRGGNRKKKK